MQKERKNKEMRNSDIVEEYYDHSYQEIHFTGKLGFFSRWYHKSVEKTVRSTNHFSKVLELGSGNGEHLSFIQHSYDEYVCLDIATPNNPDVRPKVDYVLGNAEAIPYPDNYFDRVLNLCVLHHVNDVTKVLEEIRRVLKPGGIATIYLPCDPGFLYRMLRHHASHVKTAKIMRLPVNDIKYLWSLEHSNHWLGVNFQIKKVFKKDLIKVTRYPFKGLSWNFNLFTVFKIKVVK